MIKEFRGNHSIRGRWFEFRFCAESIKAAADRLAVSKYYISTYWTAVKIDVPYADILVTPYSSNAVKLLGRDEITLERAKNIINERTRTI